MRDIKCLDVNFPIPALDPHYRSLPMRYIRLFFYCIDYYLSILHIRIVRLLTQCICFSLVLCSHLLGHEAEGSLLSYLKERGWANELGSYSSKAFRELATAGVSIELTDEGVEHVEEILEHLFAYIGILVKTGPLEWIAKEVKTEADNAFR